MISSSYVQLIQYTHSTSKRVRRCDEDSRRIFLKWQSPYFVFVEDLMTSFDWFILSLIFPSLFFIYFFPHFFSLFLSLCFFISFFFLYSFLPQLFVNLNPIFYYVFFTLSPLFFFVSFECFLLRFGFWFMNVVWIELFV